LINKRKTGEKMFQSGQSGNPAGRPKKGTCLTDILEKKLTQKKDGIKQRELIADKLIELAIAGDIPAIKYLFDRIDGKPRETVEIGNNSLEVELMGVLNAGK
jgi:hypothetical protein